MADITEARPSNGRVPTGTAVMPDGNVSNGDAPAGAPHPHLTPSRVSPRPALEISKRPSPLQRLRHLWQYRELLGNLVRKELKVKYKNSVLGFVWSLLNPLMYLVVFSFVFGAVLHVKVPYYGIFFLSGLLAWNFFSAAVMGGTSAIVMNAQLVTKVWFPRESLVLASVGAALVHFFLQSLVLFGALAVFTRAPDLTFLPTLLLGMLLLLVLTSALAIALSAINVYLRDTQHLMDVVLLAWFWFSAIAYPYAGVVTTLRIHFHGAAEWIATANPVLLIVISFQKVIYNPAKDVALIDHGQLWYLEHLAIWLAISIGMLYGALRIFSRLEDNFAEEI